MQSKLPHIPFLKEWEAAAGTLFKLRINDNASTMLSVRWEPGCTKVSMHRMFLDAPPRIIAAMTAFFRAKKRKIPPLVHDFIEQHAGNKRYVKRVPLEKLQTQGQYYDLKEIYDDLNATYFGGALDLNITWFGHRHGVNRSSMVFGLYRDSIRLIKINRKLDHPDVPPFVVAFVVYHEMVHHVCPTVVREGKKNLIHSPAFKKQERKFREFELAEEWIRTHRDRFISQKRRYGRAQ